MKFKILLLILFVSKTQFQTLKLDQLVSGLGKENKSDTLLSYFQLCLDNHHTQKKALDDSGYFEASFGSAGGASSAKSSKSAGPIPHACEDPSCRHLTSFTGKKSAKKRHQNAPIVKTYKETPFGMGQTT